MQENPLFCKRDPSKNVKYFVLYESKRTGNVDNALNTMLITIHSVTQEDKSLSC